jgi:hypothetical protein
VAACCALAAWAPVAGATPPPPTVVTGAASAISYSGATVNATVNPRGGYVGYCQFEYGASASYGSSVACSSSPGAGESAVAVKANLTALHVETSYHFRIVAASEGGTSYGNDQTFTTSHLPPFLVTEPASSITPTSATLNAWAFMHGWTIESCYFEYGVSTTYGSSGACSAQTTTNAVSLSVGGLQAGTTYHFRLVAMFAGGTISQGVDRAFTTLALTTVSPSTTPGSPLSPPPEHQASRAPDAWLARRSLVAGPHGTIRLLVSCPATVGSCAGTITLRTASAVSTRSKNPKLGVLTIASGPYRLLGGHTQVVELHIGARAQRLLAHLHVLRARVTISAVDATGAMHTTRVTVTLRKAKTKPSPRG